MILHDVFVASRRQPLSARPEFVALCDCGWEGLIRSTRGDAQRDANNHQHDEENETWK